MILQDGTTSHLQGEKSRMVEPKISLCVCVCCFSDVFGWYLELETSILNGCLVKQPFLKSRFKKSFNWSKHWHKWLFKVPGCHLREATKKHDSFFSKKKITGCRPGSTKVPCHLISGLSRKLFFRSKKKSEMVSQLEFITQFSWIYRPFFTIRKIGMVELLLLMAVRCVKPWK